jgi:hypothetical protein
MQITYLLFSKRVDDLQTLEERRTRPAGRWQGALAGADRAGNLLEVVAVAREDGTEVVIHGMRTRAKYEPFLRGEGDSDAWTNVARPLEGWCRVTDDVLDRMADEAEEGVAVTKLPR